MKQKRDREREIVNEESSSYCAREIRLVSVD